MVHKLTLSGIVTKSQIGKRLDQALAELFSDYSRSRIKQWILTDCVLVNGKKINKPKERVLGNESVIINAEIKENVHSIPQKIPLNIIYEDDNILVINKTRDLVVHTGAGNSDGTILNALLHYYPSIRNVPRAGIIHRLDKDTTGLMVVAKTILAQTYLVEELQARKITRAYEAIATGNMISGGTVEEPIARHAIKRRHMAVHPMGKPAITHYRIIENFRAHTHISLLLETGRTHQIRVHMSFIKHPLVGDPLYCKRVCYPKGASYSFTKILRGFDRQALHASMLRLKHPIYGVEMEWRAALPQDIVDLILALQEDKKIVGVQEYKRKNKIY